MSMHAFIVNSTHQKTAQSPDTLIITETTIENIRSIPSFLSKKPLKEKFNKVFVEKAHELSVIAQNAMLKILEEPVGNAEIYLVTDYPDQLLQTILSRCQINNTPTTPNPRTTLNLESITTREELLEHLDYLEYSLRHKAYDLVCETRKYVKANCNLKLCINHLASRL